MLVSNISPSDWLSLAINAVLPALVAVVTAQRAHPAVKAGLLLFLSATTGFVVSWRDAVVNAIPFDWSHAGLTALSGFIVAAVAHTYVLAPLNVTGSDGVIQTRLPRGLGAPHGRHELR